jgi:hypothetical protein
VFLELPAPDFFLPSDLHYLLHLRRDQGRQVTVLGVPGLGGLGCLGLLITAGHGGRVDRGRPARRRRRVVEDGGWARPGRGVTKTAVGAEGGGGGGGGRG